MRASPATLLGVSIFLFFQGGCGGSSAPAPPFKTSTVRGKVVYKEPGTSIEQLERAKVWFQSTADASVKAIGYVGDDGSFTMTVYTKDKTWAGVPDGTYKVALEPPLADDRQPRRDVLHPKYQDFDKSGLTVTVPVRGEIVFTVERPKR